MYGIGDVELCRGWYEGRFNIGIQNVNLPLHEDVGRIKPLQRTICSWSESTIRS